MSSSLLSLEVRHKVTQRLLFATYGLPLREAEETAAYLAVHLPLYRVVLRDRFSHEYVKEYPQHE